MVALINGADIASLLFRVVASAHRRNRREAYVRNRLSLQSSAEPTASADPRTFVPGSTRAARNSPRKHITIEETPWVLGTFCVMCQ